MKLKELRKLSKTVRIILVGLFTLSFAIVTVMVTGVILFQNELMTTLQFIAFQAFWMTMLAVNSIVFNLFKDIDFDVQARLNKVLKHIRKRKHEKAKAIAAAKARAAQKQAQDMLAAVADAGHAAPNLQLIEMNNHRKLRKQA